MSKPRSGRWRPDNDFINQADLKYLLKNYEILATLYETIADHEDGFKEEILKQMTDFEMVMMYRPISDLDDAIVFIRILLSQHLANFDLEITRDENLDFENHPRFEAASHSHYERLGMYLGFALLQFLREMKRQQADGGSPAPAADQVNQQAVA